MKICCPLNVCCKIKLSYKTRLIGKNKYTAKRTWVNIFAQKWLIDHFIARLYISIILKIIKTHQYGSAIGDNWRMIYVFSRQILWYLSTLYHFLSQVRSRNIYPTHCNLSLWNQVANLCNSTAARTSPEGEITTFAPDQSSSQRYKRLDQLITNMIFIYILRYIQVGMLDDKLNS